MSAPSASSEPVGRIAAAPSRLDTHSARSNDVGSAITGEVGTTLRRSLLELCVPDSLIAEVAYGDAFPDAAGERLWPPRAGCCSVSDLGIARMWTAIDLTHWLQRARAAFGPHHPGEIETLAATSSLLRRAGEGVQVLVAIDVVPEAQWVQHASTALAVSELVCYGPQLSDSLITTIDAGLQRVGWAASSDLANQECIVNHTPCYETSWHHQEMRHTRPA